MKNESEKEFGSKVYNSIADATGATPLVRLGRLRVDVGVDTQTLVKCKFFNPLSSVNDRIGLAMIRSAGHGRQKHPRNLSPLRRALTVNGTF